MHRNLEVLINIFMKKACNNNNTNDNKQKCHLNERNKMNWTSEPPGEACHEINISKKGLKVSLFHYHRWVKFSGYLFFYFVCFIFFII